MKTLIVIPAHNEERKIGEVIDDLRAYGYRDILVIDDGSEDKTANVVKRRGAKLVRHEINRGLGAALGTGFEYAKRNNYGFLVTFDGDGQHQASDIKKLLAPLRQGRTDVVIGSRFLNACRMPLRRKVVNFVSNLATLTLYGMWTTDTLCGLRAFNQVAIENILIKTDRMEVSNEFFLEIKKNKLRFREVPIKVVYSSYSESHSHNRVSLGHAVSIGKAMLLRTFR